MKFSIFNYRAPAKVEKKRTFFNFQFSKKSFTLIDVLVGTFLILIVFLGIFGAYQLGLKVIGQSKAKIIATALANQQMEQVRNLPYQSVGVIGGYPEGILAAATSTTSNNIEYTIETRVDFIIDSADGIAAPEDDCPNDYKKAEVKVSWSGRFSGEVVLTTDIAPKNIAQECAETGGIRSVSVFDAYGAMVTSPLIEVKDPETDQTLKTATPIDGKHYFSLAAGTYKVVISKTNYSLEQTYGSGESYDGKIIATPENPHSIILEGQLTEISFSIDKVSSIITQARGTKGAGYPVVHNVTFTLTGAKKIGLDVNENPIYKYSQEQTTDGPGQVEIPNLEWDSYSFSVLTPGLDLVGVESPPGTETIQPVGLAPDTSLSVRLIVKAENSLLVIVKDIATGEPIFSASLRLYNADLGYDTNQYTDEKGQTYFIPLTAATYNLEIEAPGYNSTSITVSVSGDVTKIVELEQIE